MKCCFFHLAQAVYRRIQDEGLQVKYNDSKDRRIKRYTHMLVALAFVPLDDVKETFALLKSNMREADFQPILKYFDKTYVNGVVARGRRQRVPPRYPPRIWNQYEAATRKEHRTNNVSEAWHNRFQIVVGKHHPDLFSALKELQKEQTDTESMVAELSQGEESKGSSQAKVGQTAGAHPVTSPFLPTI